MEKEKRSNQNGYAYDNSPSKIKPDDPELFPDIDQAIAGFEALVIWQHSGPTGDVKIPEPIQGCDEGYDMAKELVS